jgi:probable HAF family extracellular repeat protein
LLYLLLISCFFSPPGVAQTVSTHADKVSDYPRFELFDLGTLGGPNSLTATQAQLVDKRGEVIANADTPSLAPPGDVVSNRDGFASRAFVSHNGITTFFGTLGGASSGAFAISDRGEIVGGADTGPTDPATGLTEAHGAIFRRDGTVVDLGTLGGTQSVAFAVNNHGDIAGGSSNLVPVNPQFSIGLSFGAFAAATQSHATLWDRAGVIHDLGTLGGSGSFAAFLNEQGQAAGISFTSNDAAIHPFVTVQGNMVDVGTLGGSVANIDWLNNRGEAVGRADLTGFPSPLISHAFLWDGAIHDLGTLGGPDSEAFWINDDGDAVGVSDLPNTVHAQHFHAVAWNRGQIRDLGALSADDSTLANGINSKRQVIGVSVNPQTGPRAFFLQDDGPMVDLQMLVVKGADFLFLLPSFISEQGVIVGVGVTPNFTVHAFELVPTEDREGDGTERSPSNVSAEGRVKASARLSEAMPHRLRGWVKQ